MKPCIYVIANKELGMSPGKLAAQVGHATIGASFISKPEMIKAWKEGHHRWHLVMEAEDANHLDAIAYYLGEREFATHLVCDEGANEIRPYTLTALGVEIVDKDDPKVVGSFLGLKPYKTPKPEPVKTLLDPDWHWTAYAPTKYLNRKGRRYQKENAPF